MDHFDSRYIDQLAALLAIAKEGSFASAGRTLERHATIVSKRIAALEARLGVRLVERSTRHVSLTTAGELLAERIRAARELLDDAQQEATATVGMLPGQLRVALPATMGRLWLAPHLPNFVTEHSGLDLEADFDDGYVDLIAGRYDAAIRIGHLADSGLVARKLVSHQRILAASPGYLERNGRPETPDDLPVHSCIGNPRLASFPIWHLSDGHVTVAARTHGPFRTNDSMAMLEAARAGLGIVGAGEWLLAEDLGRGSLVRVLPCWTFDGDGGIYFVRPSGRYTSRRVEAFAAWATNLLTSLPWTNAADDD